MKHTMPFKNGKRPDEQCSPPPARILCADNAPALRACYTATLSHAGYDVTTVGNGREAWQALQPGDFDLLITDDQVPPLNGEELVLRMRASGMTQPIIVAASHTEFFTDRHNRWLRVTVLEKPFTLQELSDAVGRLLCSAPHVGWGEAIIEDEREPESSPIERNAIQLNTIHSLGPCDQLVPAGPGYRHWSINE